MLFVQNLGHRNDLPLSLFIVVHSFLNLEEGMMMIGVQSFGCPSSHHLSEPPGLPLGLEEGEDVALADGALHVADDLPVLLAQELHLDLGTLALGAGAAQNLDHASEGNLVHGDMEGRGSTIWKDCKFGVSFVGFEKLGFAMLFKNEGLRNAGFCDQEKKLDRKCFFLAPLQWLNHRHGQDLGPLAG